MRVVGGDDEQRVVSARQLERGAHRLIEGPCLVERQPRLARVVRVVDLAACVINTCWAITAYIRRKIRVAVKKGAHMWYFSIPAVSITCDSTTLLPSTMRK